MKKRAWDIYPMPFLLSMPFASAASGLHYPAVALDAGRRVPRVHHELAVLDYPGVIIGAVVGRYQDAVVFGYVFLCKRRRAHPEAFPGAYRVGYVRVVEIDLRALSLQELYELQRGRLPHIVDILLVRYAQDHNGRAAKALPLVVQGLCYLLDHIMGHVRVYLACKLYEPGREVVLPGLPGQVERVNGDAVAAEAGPRVEGLEAERFCLRGFDDLPDVDAHPVAEHLELVHHGYVDAPVDVLEELGHLRDAR